MTNPKISNTTSNTTEAGASSKNGNGLEDFSNQKANQTDNNRHYWTTKARKGELLLCCKIDAWFCAKATMAKNSISKRPYSAKNYSIFTEDTDLILDQLISAYQRSPFFQQTSPSTNNVDSNENSSSTSPLKDEFKKYLNKYLKKKHSAFHRSLLPFLFFCYILRCNEPKNVRSKNSSTKHSETTFDNIDFGTSPILNSRVKPLNKKLLSEIENIYPAVDDWLKDKFNMYRDYDHLSHDLNLSKTHLFFFEIFDSLNDDFDKLDFFYMLSDCFYKRNKKSNNYFLPTIYAFKDESPPIACHKKTSKTIISLLENGCLATAVHIYYSSHPSLTKKQFEILTKHKKELTEAYIEDPNKYKEDEKAIHEALTNEDLFFSCPPKTFLKQLELPFDKVIGHLLNEAKKQNKITSNLIHDMIQEANTSFDSEKKQRLCSHFRTEFEIFFYAHESGELEHPISPFLARRLQELLPQSIGTEVDKYLTCTTNEERYLATAALAEKIASLFPCSLSSDLYNFFSPSALILEINYNLEDLSDTIEQLLLYCKLQLNKKHFTTNFALKYKHILERLCLDS